VENKLRYILLIVVTIAIGGCKKSINNFSDYMKYMSEEENGLVKKKSVGGIQMMVKYLPNDYLVYNELKNDQILTAGKIDSVRKTYANSITFMMVIGPSKDESFDITRVGVADYEEFAQRLEQMNFSMGQFVNLKIGETTYIPELAQMESTYGLEQNRKILFVFNAVNDAGNKILMDDVQFVYVDELFNIGINKFKFSKEDLTDLPAFKFKK